MSEALKLPPVTTVEEFLAWNAPAGTRWELVDGELRAMAPARRAHASIQSRLNTIIANHLDARRPECEVLANPGVIPRVRARDNFRIPDLGVTCRAAEPGEHAVRGLILVVEVLSPSNTADTWTNVWTYCTIPSIREILLIESDTVAAYLIRRDPDGAWPHDPARIEDGEDVALDSIGMTFPLRALYAGVRLG